MIQRPIFVLLLLFGLGAMFVVYAGTTASTARSVAILKGIPELWAGVHWSYALFTCVLLVMGYWQVRRLKRDWMVLAVFGIVFVLSVEVLLPEAVFLALGRPHSTFHGALWFLHTAGIPWKALYLLIPLSMAAMLSKRPRKSMT